MHWKLGKYIVERLQKNINWKGCKRVSEAMHVMIAKVKTCLFIFHKQLLYLVRNCYRLTVLLLFILASGADGVLLKKGMQF